MILAVVQARMTSSRLPGKVLADVAGRPMLARQLERIGRSTRIDAVVVATSEHASDDPVAATALECGVAVHRGALLDVLGRVVAASRPYHPDHVVRLTADCPLTDPTVLDALVELHVAGGCDYSSNCWDPTFPHGLDAEIVTARWLRRLDALARTDWEREHVTVWFRAHEDRIRRGELRSPTPRPEVRLTVDHPEDLALVRAIYGALLPRDPAFGTADVLALLDAHPELARCNAGAASVRLRGASAGPQPSTGVGAVAVR